MAGGGGVGDVGGCVFGVEEAFERRKKEGRRLAGRDEQNMDGKSKKEEERERDLDRSYSLSRNDCRRVRALEVVTIFSFTQERGSQRRTNGAVKDDDDEDETAGEEIARWCQHHYYHDDVECGGRVRAHQACKEDDGFPGFESRCKECMYVCSERKKERRNP